jgi:protoheme IX farnesyltransferase
VAVGLNAVFVLGAWRIWRRTEEAAEADGYRVEKRVFTFSLAYLFGHFAALLVEATPWAAALRAQFTLWGA